MIETLFNIILALMAVILLLVAVAGAAYVVILLSHEWRWRKAKDERYDNYHND